jgi:hypothetical protein
LDTDGKPRLIGTLLYSDLVVSGTKYVSYKGALSRLCKGRTFLLTNNTSIASGTVSATPYDSVADFPAKGGGATLSSSVTANGSSTTNDGVSGVLRANVDSVMVSVTWGATLPTSGDLKIYVMEVF